MSRRTLRSVSVQRLLAVLVALILAAILVTLSLRSSQGDLSVALVANSTTGEAPGVTAL